MMRRGPRGSHRPRRAAERDRALPFLQNPRGLPGASLVSRSTQRHI